MSKAYAPKPADGPITIAIKKADDPQRYRCEALRDCPCPQWHYGDYSVQISGREVVSGPLLKFEIHVFSDGERCNVGDNLILLQNPALLVHNGTYREEKVNAMPPETGKVTVDVPNFQENLPGVLQHYVNQQIDKCLP